MKKSKKCWCISVGSYGATVRLSELQPGGNLYLIWLDQQGRQQKRSLGHRDRRLGRQQAQEAAATMVRGGPTPNTSRPTLRDVVDAYVKDGLHGRTARYASETEWRLRLVAGFFGLDRKVETLSPSDVQRLTAARNAGKVETSDGKKLAKPRSATTGWHDVNALRMALNWATMQRNPSGIRFLAENPIRDVRIGKNANPNRPHASEDYYQRLRAVADEVDQRLALCLDLARETGRRINAILHLRWEDVSFTAAEHAPHGSIIWDKQWDKMKTTRRLPMNERAASSLRAAWESSGKPARGWVFASSTTDDGACAKNDAKDWLRRAEKRAGIEHVVGQGWHSFRRAWANARKHYPIADLMAAGGWSDKESLLNCYTAADPATVFRVVNEPTEAPIAGQSIQQPIQPGEAKEAPDTLSVASASA